MIIDEQVKIMEAQINSKHAGFTLMQKVSYLAQFFDEDPLYSKEARDIVRANLVKGEI